MLYKKKLQKHIFFRKKLDIVKNLSIICTPLRERETLSEKVKYTKI